MRAHRLLIAVLPLIVACTPGSTPSDPRGNTAANTLSPDLGQPEKVYCSWVAGAYTIMLMQAPDQIGTAQCTYDYAASSSNPADAVGTTETSDDCYCPAGYTLPSDALLCAASVDTDVGVTTFNYQLSDGSCLDERKSSDGTSDVFQLFVPCTGSDTCTPASP